MRPVDIVTTAAKNAFRSKLRTALTVIAIFIGAFTLTITSAIGAGISSYIDAQLASIGADDVMSVTSTPDESIMPGDGPQEYDPDAPVDGGMRGGGAPGFAGGPLTDDDLEEIADTEGVTKVDPVVLITPRWIRAGDGDEYEVQVNVASAMTKADLATGSQLSASAEENQVVLPMSYLDALGFEDAESAVGRSVTIGAADHRAEMHEVEAEIVGVQNETLAGGGVGLNQNLIDEIDRVESIGEPETVAESYFMAVAYFDAEAGEERVDEIKAALADKGYTAQTVADQIGEFQAVVAGITGVLNAFAAIALVAAGFGIVNTLLMSVQERTREIGLMKAMGMSRGRIFALFSFEAVFIGFLGSVIGAVVAVVVGSIVSSVLAQTVLADLQGLRIMEFAPASVGGIVLAVMLIAFLAGTLPARRAARQDPIDALRYE